MNNKIRHILSKEGFFWLLYYLILALKIDKKIPDSLYVRILYRCVTGDKLHLNHPVGYTEKLQWLKCYYHNPIMTTMVDKYSVKQFVISKIGIQYVIPLLGVWNSFDEIDFDGLPNQCVIKCSHDCGGLLICKNKNDIDKNHEKHKIDSCLKRNFYWNGREWPYKDVKPVVFAEKYMEDDSGELRDYKVMCFNGVAKIIQVHINRFKENHTQHMFDINWNPLKIGQQGYETANVSLPKPNCLQEMITLSERLAADLPHVRVDWYIVEDKLLFGEFTFYDAAGFEQFQPKEIEIELGNWISLPQKML